MTEPVSKLCSEIPTRWVQIFTYLCGHASLHCQSSGKSHLPSPPRIKALADGPSVFWGLLSHAHCAHLTADKGWEPGGGGGGGCKAGIHGLKTKFHVRLGRQTGQIHRIMELHANSEFSLAFQFCDSATVNVHYMYTSVHSMTITFEILSS